MQEILNTLFPTFSKELNNDIETSAKIHTFKAGEVIMRTGQYINHTMLLTKGQIKIYREGENGGEFFMYSTRTGMRSIYDMCY